jgi:class 3 adenylate cyclase/tetratricopeptide (TPR) repeat protein
MSCGGPLPAGGLIPAREVRKVVTVVFADVTGSTGLGERLDPESLRAVMGRWFEAMRAVLERHGGTVEKFIGDAVVAVFGVPVLHEDDALRAVRATQEMRTALATLNVGLRAERGLEIAMRIGVNTGEVVVGDARAGGARATGDAVNVAARLQQAADPGEILVGEATWRLVRDAVDAGDPSEIAVRGRNGPVGARNLRGVHQGAEAIPRRIGGPMVGREREMAILRGAFERSIAEESCALVTVLGSPGVGKSRLVHEFLAHARERALVLRGRCLPYGEGITWWPVAELLRSAVGLDEAADPAGVRAALHRLLAGAPDQDALLDRLAEPLGMAAAPVPRDELFWAVRRFLERIADARPVVVVLDDLQWAESTLLDLLEHVADWASGVPILLLAMARPDLLDTRPGWGGGKSNATSFLLEPLPQAQTEALVASLLEGASLPIAAVERIAAAADGNPLYVEQLVEMLHDDGAVRLGADGSLAAGNLDAITVPPTIQALLAARLDRLADPERRMIERAAVVGKEFRRLEVTELTPETGREGIPGQLMALVRKELIRPDRRRDDADETFRFRHLLIRDAAYEGLPKSERAELHERFADWLERTAGERLAEVDEIVGYHLDQARTYRLALGPDDERTRALALRAGRRLAAAGLRAEERDELPAAVRLLEHAEALLVEDAAARFDTLVHLVACRWSTGAFGAFAEAAFLIAEVAPAVGELAVLRSRLWVGAARGVVDPSYVTLDGLATVEEATKAFEAAGDVDGLLDADSMRSQIHLNQARWRETGDAARVGWERARAAGRDRMLHLFARWLANAMTWGMEPVDSGLATIRELLATTSRRSARQALLMCAAHLHAYAGDRAAADSAVDEAMATRDELGLGRGHADFRLAEIERALDDPEASLAAARRNEAWLAAAGETGMRSTIVVIAGLACLTLGDHEEALRLAAEGRRLAAPDDAISQVLWRAVEAVARARRGEHDAADHLSVESLDIASRTDGIGGADAWLARAEVLHLGGRLAEARAAALEARATYAAKGFVNGVSWAEARLASLGDAAAPA